MKDRNDEILKERLAEGFAELTPDRWSEIREAAFSDRDISPVEVKLRRPRSNFIRAAAVAAAVFICICSYAIKDIRTVTAKLYIDVNPSVSISLNRHGKVVRMEGINDDGRKVVESVSGNIKDPKDLGETVTSVINEIDKEGYFRDGKTDVLISLGSADGRGKDALTRAGDAARQYSGPEGVSLSVVTQVVPDDAGTEEAAAEAGMSPGKYVYVLKKTGKDKLDAAEAETYKEMPISEIDKGPAGQTDQEEAEDTDTDAPEDDQMTDDGDTDSVDDGEEASGNDGQSGDVKKKDKSDNGKKKEKADKSKDKGNKDKKKDKDKSKDKAKSKDKGKDKDKEKGKSNNGKSKGKSGKKS